MASKRLIVIAIDGSGAADHAFETYLRTLKKPGDTVLLFSCQELDDVMASFWKGAVFNCNPDVLHEKLQKEGEERKAMLKPYGDRLHEAGVQFRPVILVSQSPGVSLVTTAQSENADLIVMGCRGHSALTRTLIGSVSGYVVQHSDIPVVVCRANC